MRGARIFFVSLPCAHAQGSVSLVSSGIYYVHWEQKDEKEKLREGVRRDKIRLEKKLLEQQRWQKKREEEKK